MRILITDRNFAGDPALEQAAVGPEIELEIFPDPKSVTEEAWRRADGIVTYRGTATVTANMGLLDRCRIVVRGGVGFDGLDLVGLGAKGIAVCTVPDYGTTEVADHAIALMLALRRGIATYHDKLRADPAKNWGWAGAPLVDRLRGRTFGVFGLGRIGTAAARRAQAFDMAVQFFDPYLPDGADLATGWKRLSSIDELFASSDAISLHSPLTDETRKIVNARVLDSVKAGAVLVNTSRGGVVDVDAVYDALKSGRLAGAALDVLPTEPPADHPLVAAYAAREPWIEGRLILTPHAAFYSPPGLEDLRRKAVSAAAACLRHGTLRNCQNLAQLRR